MAKNSVLPPLPIYRDISRELLKNFNSRPYYFQLRQDHLRLTVLIHLLTILQPALQLLNDDMRATNPRLDMLLGSSVYKQQDIPAALAGVAVLVEHIGFLIRVEDDVSGCDKVLPELRGSEMKNPPVPLIYGIASAEMGRPRAVEKGSPTWAVKLEVVAGLYILGPAERMTIDSRISTWTSLIS